MDVVFYIKSNSVFRKEKFNTRVPIPVVLPCVHFRGLSSTLRCSDKSCHFQAHFVRVEFVVNIVFKSIRKNVPVLRSLLYYSLPDIVVLLGAFFLDVDDTRENVAYTVCHTLHKIDTLL